MVEFVLDYILIVSTDRNFNLKSKTRNDVTQDKRFIRKIQFNKVKVKFC